MRVMFKFNNKAQAMAAIFVYVSVVAFIAVYVTTYAQSLHRMVVRNVEYMKGFYAAEMALIWEMAEIRRHHETGDPLHGIDPMAAEHIHFPLMDGAPANELFHRTPYLIKIDRKVHEVQGVEDQYTIGVTARLSD